MFRLNISVIELFVEYIRTAMSSVKNISVEEENGDILIKFSKDGKLVATKLITDKLEYLTINTSDSYLEYKYAESPIIIQFYKTALSDPDRVSVKTFLSVPGSDDTKYQEELLFLEENSIIKRKDTESPN